MADPIVKKVTELIAADSVAADDLFIIVDVSEAIASNKTKKALARLITLYNPTQITDGIVTNSKIATGAVTAIKLATDAVETAKIKDANVTTAKIATGAVTAIKLATDAVETAKIKDANVTTAKIADGAVTAIKLATDAVETAKIKDANVTTAKIADGAVTVNKLAGSIVPYIGKFYLDGTLPTSDYILPTGWSVVRLSQGKYRVTHNFGSRKYLVILSGLPSSVVGHSNEANNTFDIESYSLSSNPNDNVIHFVVYKFG